MFLNVGSVSTKITQSILNHTSFGVLQSLLLGTIVLIGSNKIVGQIVGFLLAAGIGVAGYHVGNYWGEDAAIIVSIIAFLSALGANLAGIEWTQDINKK